METQEKLLKLISNSILISDEKRNFFLTIAPTLSEEKSKKLIKILETEETLISKSLKDSFEQDKTGNLANKFQEFLRKDARELLSDVENKNTEAEEPILSSLDQELSKI